MKEGYHRPRAHRRNDVFFNTLAQSEEAIKIFFLCTLSLFKKPWVLYQPTFGGRGWEGFPTDIHHTKNINHAL